MRAGCGEFAKLLKRAFTVAGCQGFLKFLEADHGLAISLKSFACVRLVGFFRRLGHLPKQGQTQ